MFGEGASPHGVRDTQRGMRTGGSDQACRSNCRSLGSPQYGLEREGAWEAQELGQTGSCRQHRLDLGEKKSVGSREEVGAF